MMTYRDFFNSARELLKDSRSVNVGVETWDHRRVTGEMLTTWTIYCADRNRIFAGPTPEDALAHCRAVVSPPPSVLPMAGDVCDVCA